MNEQVALAAQRALEALKALEAELDDARRLVLTLDTEIREASRHACPRCLPLLVELSRGWKSRCLDAAD